MQIHTHSSSGPWEKSLASPPSRAMQQEPAQSQAVDTFKASPNEKSHSTLLTSSLLALTTLTTVVAQPAAAQVMETQTPASQEVTPQSLTSKGFQNPDDWKESLHGGPFHNHCPALPRPILNFRGPDAWKANLGAPLSLPQIQKKGHKTHNPVQLPQTRRSQVGNPDDWKSELGGGDYRPSPPNRRESRPSKRTSSANRAPRYDGPDSWKEGIGGGYYEPEPSEHSDTFEQDDWGGPDDWKGGL